MVEITILAHHEAVLENGAGSIHIILTLRFRLSYRRSPLLYSAMERILLILGFVAIRQFVRMDLPKWLLDNFCPIMRRSAVLELFLGPPGSTNPRTRVDFERFSEMSEN